MKNWLLGTALLCAIGCGAKDERPAEMGTASTGCELVRDVSLNPNACLVVTGSWKDSGIVRHYREMVEISIKNTSPYTIGQIDGEVTWVNADGATAGTVPFKTAGAIPPGGTRLFTEDARSLFTTKLETNAPTYKIRITQAAAE